jgi:two-component system OmpR family sensor kinase
VLTAPWLSTAGKAGVTVALGALVTGLMQWALLSGGTKPAVAIAVPLLWPPLAGWVYTTYFVRHRAGALVTTFTRVAEGDLEAEMPPAPDADLVPVRAAFARMGAALRDATTRLRHADAQRRRLFADLAHELATPTSTILGVSDALQTPELSDKAEDRAWLLASLDHEIGRLVRLIRDVRDLADLEDPEVAFDFQALDLAEVVSSVTERMQRLEPAGARIERGVEPAPVLADAARLEQVLVNLVANARRHAPADGVVRVRVSTTGPTVRLVVEDDGPGVGDEDLPHLGERLFRTDRARGRSGGGHGLGLSIVAATVQRHGGGLAFDRSELGGLRVVVELPVHAGEPGPSQAASAR